MENKLQDHLQIAQKSPRIKSLKLQVKYLTSKRMTKILS